MGHFSKHFGALKPLITIQKYYILVPYCVKFETSLLSGKLPLQWKSLMLSTKYIYTDIFKWFVFHFCTCLSDCNWKFSSGVCWSLGHGGSECQSKNDLLPTVWVIPYHESINYMVLLLGPHTPLRKESNLVRISSHFFCNSPIVPGPHILGIQLIVYTCL